MPMRVRSPSFEDGGVEYAEVFGIVSQPQRNGDTVQLLDKAANGRWRTRSAAGIEASFKEDNLRPLHNLRPQDLAITSSAAAGPVVLLERLADGRWETESALTNDVVAFEHKELEPLPPEASTGLPRAMLRMLNTRFLGPWASWLLLRENSAKMVENGPVRSVLRRPTPARGHLKRDSLSHSAAENPAASSRLMWQAMLGCKRSSSVPGRAPGSLWSISKTSFFIAALYSAGSGAGVVVRTLYANSGAANGGRCARSSYATQPMDQTSLLWLHVPVCHTSGLRYSGLPASEGRRRAVLRAHGKVSTGVPTDVCTVVA